MEKNRKGTATSPRDLRARLRPRQAPHQGEIGPGTSAQAALRAPPARGDSLHLLKVPGKIKHIFPGVKSIPFKNKRVK